MLQALSTALVIVGVQVSEKALKASSLSRKSGLFMHFFLVVQCVLGAH